MSYKIIVDTSYRDRPKDHELSAAVLLTEYFACDIIIVRPTLQHTPDFLIKEKTWELKSPLGNGKNTIKNNLHTARKQSANVIIDLRRCKLHQSKALANIKGYFKDHQSQIKHLIIITKSNKIIELF